MRPEGIQMSGATVLGVPSSPYYRIIKQPKNDGSIAIWQIRGKQAIIILRKNDLKCRIISHEILQSSVKGNKVFSAK